MNTFRQKLKPASLQATTGLEMSTQLMPEDVPAIDADPFTD